MSRTSGGRPRIGFVVLLGLLGPCTPGWAMEPGSTGSAGAAPRTAKILGELQEAAVRIRDLSCLVEDDGRVRVTTEDGQLIGERRRVLRSRLWIERPHRARLEVDLSPTRRETRIVDGPVSWQYQRPGTVRKTLQDRPSVDWIPQPMVDMDSLKVTAPVPDPTRPVMDRLEFVRTETLDGVSCHVFTGAGRTFWIGVDGVARRIEIPDGRVTLRRILDVRLDRGLDPALFAFAPRPGADVTEVKMDGARVEERTYQVPWEKPRLTPEERRATRDRLAEVARAFAAVEAWSARYREKRVEEGALALDSLGKASAPTNLKMGTIRVQGPGRVHFEYQDIELPGGKVDAFYIADGTWSWFCDQIVPGKPGCPIHPAPVKKRRLPADADGARPHPHPDVIRKAALHPLRGVDPDYVVHEAIEPFAGERVHRFRVHAGPDHPAGVHWIGVDDGLPRRIEEAGDGRGRPAVEIAIDQVTVVDRFPDEVFGLPAGGAFKVEEVGADAPSVSAP